MRGSLRLVVPGKAGVVAVVAVVGVLAACTALAAAAAGVVEAGAAGAGTHGLTARELVTLERISEPRLNPDGQRLAYTLRQTDYDGNRALRSIWLLARSDGSAQPRRLTVAGSNAWSPRWSADGHSLFFLSDRSGSEQVWRLDDQGGEARQVTRLPLGVESFRLAPDDQHLALSVSVYTDCAELACTRERLDRQAALKRSGRLYDQLFVRHWDEWSDGRRHQLFAAELDEHGALAGEPRRVSQGVDGDVPSRPFGDESEYAFAPDSHTLYFDARAGDRREAWSTNFDVYAAPVDGSALPRNLTAANPAWDGFPLPSADGAHLYYLAMRRPGFEADRFGIMELDLASGRAREVAPGWDRSAGALTLSADGRALLTLADDEGDRALFSVDIASGTVRRVLGGGNIAEVTQVAGTTVVARDTLRAPADLLRVQADGSVLALTAVNAERLKNVDFGAVQTFRFKGWNGDPVRGHVVQPSHFQAGQRYPVAFFIHGGPQGSWLDEFHYRWNPQVFAGAGFAVVAIDFHGSTGYGQAFTDAISGHWGDRPLEDLQRGWAAALARFPWLDGSRACALGASYGGYMVDWIAGNWIRPESGAWRCLVSHDGVFDARMMYYSTEELWFDEWETGGLPWQQPQNYERFNPALHVGDWSVPMLVVHGGKDFRIPLEQGLAAFTALQRRGVPSQLLTFPDENHWVLKPQNSVQWHEVVLDWLKRWTAAAP